MNKIYYFVFINIFTLLLYLFDKIMAKLKMRRISERNLLIMSFLGGGIGAMIGVFVIRHKSKHKKFLILVPISFVLSTCMIILLKYLV